MRLKHLKLLVLSVVTLTCAQVYAQNTLVELENTKSDQGTYSIDGTYTGFFSTNAYRPGSPDHQSSSDHILTGRLHLPQHYMLSTSLWLNQDFGNERELQTRDSLLTLTKPMGKLIGDISWISRASLTLPLSEKSNKTDGLISAFRLNPLFTWNAKAIIPGLNIIFRPTIIKNFYQYETSLNGRSNFDYTINQRLTFFYSMTDSIFLSLDNTYIKSWTYSGLTNDFYSFDQSLTFVLTKNLSGFVGHAIGGNALAVNGQEMDFRIYDLNNSNYYLGLSYQF